MRAALARRAKGIGRTSPNPAVGAVLVVGGKIVARGHHRGAGRRTPRSMPVAELNALGSEERNALCDARAVLDDRADTALHRCDLIASGIKTLSSAQSTRIRVMPAAACRRWRRRESPCEPVCLPMNAPRSTKASTNGSRPSVPFVIAKCGMSLDGRLTTTAG